MSTGDVSTTKNVPDVEPSENLARAITTSSEARQARNGNVRASVFTYYGKSKVSVDRIDRMETADAVRHGENIATIRGPNRKFYGWAVMTVAEVLEEGSDVEAAPETDNDWHAHIVMPRPAAFDEDVHDEHAGQLARRAVWKDIPTPSGDNN